MVKGFLRSLRAYDNTYRLNKWKHFMQKGMLSQGKYLECRSFLNYLQNASNLEVVNRNGTKDVLCVLLRIKKVIQFYKIGMFYKKFENQYRASD